MRRAVALTLFLLFAFAGAQSVVDALRGSAKRMSVADLPEGYRAVVLDPKPADGSHPVSDPKLALMSELRDVVFVDPDAFSDLLDGKRPRIRGYAEAKDGIEGPAFAEVWIEGGRIARWSPRPEMTRAALLQAFPPPPSAATPSQQAAIEGAKAVANGLILYAQDYEGRFPGADSTPKAMGIAAPYLSIVKGSWTSRNPNGGRLLYNTALADVAAGTLSSGNSDDGVTSPTLLLWDERPWPDGGRVVAYTDGNAKYLKKDEWVAAWRLEERRRRAFRR